MIINSCLNEKIKEEFLSFINGKNPFSRENPIGHITGSCWIINRDRTSVLLTHHKKLDIWIPTGGHSEGETDPFDTALREGEEETGLKLIPQSKEPFYMDIHAIPEYKTTPAHKHFDFTYLFYPKSNEDFIVSEESFNLKWIPLDKIEEYTREINVLHMRNKTLEM
jgi:8-oxo-dGTP pyrophosphatase MutT (NUDIX family)